MNQTTRPTTESLLPHDPPMVLLDRYVDDTDGGVVCEVDIREDSRFATEEGVPAYVGIEFMAQAIGVYAGLEQKSLGKPPEIGYLLGSKRVDLHCDFYTPGQTLSVTAAQIWDGGKVVQFKCSVKDKQSGDTLATANISAYAPFREVPDGDG